MEPKDQAWPFPFRTPLTPPRVPAMSSLVQQYRRPKQRPDRPGNPPAHGLMGTQTGEQWILEKGFPEVIPDHFRVCEPRNGTPINLKIGLERRLLGVGGLHRLFPLLVICSYLLVLRLYRVDPQKLRPRAFSRLIGAPLDTDHFRAYLGSKRTNLGSTVFCFGSDHPTPLPPPTKKKEKQRVLPLP